MNTNMTRVSSVKFWLQLSHENKKSVSEEPEH